MALNLVNLSPPLPEGRGLPSTRAQAEGLEVNPEPRFSTPRSKAGIRKAERVNGGMMESWKSGLHRDWLSDLNPSSQYSIVPFFSSIFAVYVKWFSRGVLWSTADLNIIKSVSWPI